AGIEGPHESLKDVDFKEKEVEMEMTEELLPQGIEEKDEDMCQCWESCTSEG
ncbi:hypothetical protein HDU82_003953, partial [Entophlyctis luteolus]